jgi:hypothetical protein
MRLVHGHATGLPATADRLPQPVVPAKPDSAAPHLRHDPVQRGPGPEELGLRIPDGTSEPADAGFESRPAVGTSDGQPLPRSGTQLSVCGHIGSEVPQ